jgi:hypothetical protein
MRVTTNRSPFRTVRLCASDRIEAKVPRGFSSRPMSVCRILRRVGREPPRAASQRARRTCPRFGPAERAEVPSHPGLGTPKRRIGVSVPWGIEWLAVCVAVTVGPFAGRVEAPPSERHLPRTFVCRSFRFRMKPGGRPAKVASGPRTCSPRGSPRTIASTSSFADHRTVNNVRGQGI